MTSTFNLRRFLVMANKHAKIEVEGQLVQMMETMNGHDRLQYLVR